MTGPFPGVDPYLEDQFYWMEFHGRFLYSLQEVLGDHLPDDYEARIDERVKLVDVESDSAIQIRPDVAVTYSSGRPSAGTAALLDPDTIPTIVMDEDREVFLKVLHRPDRKVVTIIELLSPANKSESDRRDYLTRRNAIMHQPVHLVELDFLVAGQSVPMRRPMPPTDFHAILSRWEQRPDCQVYSWGVRQGLPSLPIPLRAPDPDVMIDMADVYATAYQRGRYAKSVDYRRALSVPLAEADRAWAEERGRAFVRPLSQERGPDSSESLTHPGTTDRET